MALICKAVFPSISTFETPPTVSLKPGHPHPIAQHPAELRSHRAHPHSRRSRARPPPAASLVTTGPPASPSRREPQGFRGQTDDLTVAPQAFVREVDPKRPKTEALRLPHTFPFPPQRGDGGCTHIAQSSDFFQQFFRNSSGLWCVPDAMLPPQRQRCLCVRPDHARSISWCPHRTFDPLVGPLGVCRPVPVGHRGRAGTPGRGGGTRRFGTGDRRFQSLETLLAFMAQMLGAERALRRAVTATSGRKPWRCTGLATSCRGGLLSATHRHRRRRDTAQAGAEYRLRV